MFAQATRAGVSPSGYRAAIRVFDLFGGMPDALDRGGFSGA
jgi:hypothetical protein